MPHELPPPLTPTRPHIQTHTNTHTHTHTHTHTKTFELKNHTKLDVKHFIVINILHIDINNKEVSVEHVFQRLFSKTFIYIIRYVRLLIRISKASENLDELDLVAEPDFGNLLDWK